MITRHTHKNLVWIDLENPDSGEVRQLMEEYNLDPLVAEELLTPTLKPRVDPHPDFIYLILHFPASKHTHGESANQEVDFIIGKNFLITTRYDTIDPLHKFSKVFEVNTILGRGDMGDHAGFIFFHMIRKLYKSVEHELEYIHDAAGDIEDRIFSGKEKEMVVDISRVNRELLNFKRSLSSHREVLESFEIAGRSFFGHGFEYHLKAITGEYFRVENQIDRLLDFVSELRETNNAIVSTKQNEIMKLLTIMAFITFPLSLMASIFGMNTKILPIVGHRYDFWIIIGMMGVATVLFFSFFKYKKWL